LLRHSNVRVTYLAAATTTGTLNSIHPEFLDQTKLSCEKFKIQKAQKICDALFVAVPHTQAMNIVPELIKADKRVIDLSADYRFPKASEYKKYYGHEHTDKANLSKAVYGLPEIYREEIKHAQLIANPGCYPTSAILGLLPLTSTFSENIQQIIIDAKSGVTGAGKKLTNHLMFSEVNENLKAYKVLSHQHKPEIENQINKMAGHMIPLAFVPHLVPMNQGILSTMYLFVKKPLSLAHIHKIYKNFYKTEPSVRILPLGQQPETKNVFETHYCDIGLAIKDHLIVVTSAIDNLMKGAASQAVQNMNIMYGFQENLGID
jgi:N-acetyl-gamma-glutamyl-phosphate reductase